MKVIAEYASRLAADGYNVNIVYPGSIMWKKRPLIYKVKSIYHYFKHQVQGYSCKRWIKMDPHVKEYHPISLYQKFVPKSDIYIATEVRTAPYLEQYECPEGCKFYFIQDYENWFVDDDYVVDTYRSKLRKIVISTWLKTIVDNYSVLKSELLANGFDFSYFSKYKEIRDRDKFIIGTLYHSHKRKDFSTTFAALSLVKNRYPQLRILVFGTESRPDFFPSWFEYYQKPDKETHNRIYNESAIFVGSSINEGWGLTIGEAMMCGAAIACTDNNGYREMVIDGETGLLSPVGDSKALANNIISLIENDALRIKLANQGNKYIASFDIEKSYNTLKRILNLK